MSVAIHSANKRLRVLALPAAEANDWREPAPSGNFSRFVKALEAEFELIDVVQPAISSREWWTALALSARPGRARWHAHAAFSPYLARRRTEAAQRALDAHRGSFDLVLQLQTLFAPSVGRAGTRYAIYTDNTMALTQRHYPGWYPLSESAARRWMEFEAGVCRGADTVFTFSEFARRSVIDDYRCAPEDVVAVGAGANHLVDELPRKDSVKPRALFVGTNFEIKGGPVLLRAWRIVTRELPEAELVIAGPKRDPTRGRTRGVKYVGRVPHDEVARLYRSASVFVMPSLFEAWGHVFQEAMGYGLPCVGSSCCAMAEIIEEGVSGRLVAPGDAEALAAVLVALLSDPQEAARMGAAGHRRILLAGKWSDVVGRIAQHLTAKHPRQQLA